MNDFVSVHDMVFGGRGAISGGSADDFLLKFLPDEKPIEVTRVVCAIEIWRTYHYDDFGRLGIANDEAKTKVKAVLAKYENEIPFCGDVDRLFDSHKNLLSLPQEEILDWISVGWLKDDLPDFEACYQQWKAANGMDGVDAPPMLLDRQAPSSQSHLWKLMNQLLKLVVGDEAHQLIKKDDYKTAISTLENKGLRWAENEKKALRRNLKTIVTNVQQ